MQNGCRFMGNASTLRAAVSRIDGGITAPFGFMSAALHCGIKAKAGALDLTLVAAEQRASAAGLFTTNLAQAAPVLLSKRHLQQTTGLARAIVVNSGCANACTGSQGLADAETMAREAAAAIGCAVEDVLVASTGVIGVNLPMGKVASGIRSAGTQLARGRG